MVNWKITNIEYITLQDGLSKVAKNVHWFCWAEDSEGNYGNCWGNQQLDVSNLNADTFVDFDMLLETDMIDKVKLELGGQLAQIEAFVLGQVNSGERTRRDIGLPANWS